MSTLMKIIVILILKQIATPPLPYYPTIPIVAVSEELGDKQTNRLTHSLTDWCFDREIRFFAQIRHR